MKRILTIIAVSLFAVSLNAQNSIDKLFNKYKGADGFVSVSINGNMLKLIAEFDDEDDEVMKHADKFTSIRILAQEDESLKVDNFYDLVMDELNKGDYEELMTINSSDSDVRILVRSEGKVFKEFILVAGGDDNALIQIKGNLTFDEVKEMGNSIKEGDKNSIINLR